MESGTIVIRRFSSVYRCTPRQDACQRTRDRLDAVVLSGVGRQVEAMAAGLARTDDRSVWVIRRLSLRCVVHSAWDDDRIVRVWARQLVHALAMELGSGGTDGVIRFDSPAAQLAHFIADLAAGDAFGKWYNRGFAGLKALPPSVAIRTALVDAGPDGLEALRALGREQALSVLHRLSPGDAFLLLQAFAAIPDAASLTDVLALAGSALRRRLPYAVDDPRWGLAILVATGPAQPDAARTMVQAVAAIALHMLRRQAAKAGPPSSRGAWLHTLGGAEALARLPPALLQELPVFADEVAESVHTPFGAGFLLLPVLLSMPLDAWLRDWPGIAGIPADRLVRALVLAGAQGPGRCRMFLEDPVWRDVLGLPADIDWPGCLASLARLGPKARRALRVGLAEHARDQGAQVQAELRRAVRAGSELWRVDRDAAGYWHRITAVKETVSAEEGDAGPDADAAHLAGLQALPLPPAWQGLLSLAAQQVLRRFARRLPGFALSHFDYLYRNFLDFPATVQAQGERSVVCLGHAPLALILNLAGMTRTEYALPWHPGHVHALHVEAS